MNKDTETDSQSLSLGSPGKNTKKNNQQEAMPLSVLAGMLAALLGILVTIIFVVFFWQSRSQKLTVTQSASSVLNQEESADTPVQDTSQSQTESATQAAEPADQPPPEELDSDQLAELSVQILNGAGESGLAGRISRRLEDEGFETINAGNANNFSYQGISVSFKEEVDKSDELLELISETFSEYEVSKGDTLDEDSNYDLVLVVGSE